MLRAALAIALGFAVVTLAGTNYDAKAEDKKDEKKVEAKKLEGTLTCTKCALKETEKCGNALVVKQGDKKITYYLADTGNKEKYHACTKDVEGVTVTGKVVEKEKKLTVESPKVELPKK